MVVLDPSWLQRIPSRGGPGRSVFWKMGFLGTVVGAEGSSASTSVCVY